MSDPIEFYIEFSSPYVYVAAKEIEEVAAKHGREVVWRPLSLGHVWKAIGATNVGVASVPEKSKYFLLDSYRSAKLAGLPMEKPAVFPVDAKLARLAFYRINKKDAELAKKFAYGVMEKVWAKSEEITEVEHLLPLAESLGFVRDDIEGALDDSEAKAAMIASTNEAVESGAFGTPWFKVDDQVFWGADRVGHIDKYLSLKAA